MDAKSLLRAKKASARIEHPYASYNAAGVLRCSICAVPGKLYKIIRS
jgi:zinc finger protein 830